MDKITTELRLLLSKLNSVKPGYKLSKDRTLPLKLVKHTNGHSIYVFDINKDDKLSINCKLIKGQSDKYILVTITDNKVYILESANKNQKLFNKSSYIINLIDKVYRHNCSILNKFDINGVKFTYDKNKIVTEDMLTNDIHSGYTILWYNNKNKSFNIYFNPTKLSENNLINGYIVYLKLDKGKFYKLCIDDTSIFPSGWNQITQIIPKDSLKYGVIQEYINELLKVKGEIKWLKPQSYIAKGAMSLVTMSTIETELLHMGVAVSTTYIDKYKQGSKISKFGLIEKALNELRDLYNCPFFVYTFSMFKCNSNSLFNSKFRGFVSNKNNIAYLSEEDRELYDPIDYNAEEIEPIIKNINNLPILTNYCKSMSYSKPYGYEIEKDDLILYLNGVSSRYDMEMAIDNEKLARTPNVYFQHILMELIAGNTVTKENPNLTSDQRLSIFVQVLCALQVAQEVYKFEHMDLHGGNVMLIPTNDQYVDMKTKKYKYKIKLYGYMIKIIDMDFAKITIKSDDTKKIFYTLDISEFGGAKELRLAYNIDFTKFRPAYDMLYFLYSLFRRYDEKQFYMISKWISDIHESHGTFGYDADKIYNKYARPKLNARATPQEVLRKFDNKFIIIKKLK